MFITRFGPGWGLPGVAGALEPVGAGLWVGFRAEVSYFQVILDQSDLKLRVRNILANVPSVRLSRHVFLPGQEIESAGQQVS